MQLEWHELICEEEEPDYPETSKRLLFHVYETGDTWFGWFDTENRVFVSIAQGDGWGNDYWSESPLNPERLRVAWAYVDMSTANFPKFDAIEKGMKAIYESALKSF